LSQRHHAWTDGELAHLVLRLTLGLNIAVHGLVRVGHAGAFAASLVHDFQATVLPAWSVEAFGFALPFLELTVGVAIVIGLKLRATVFAGAALMAALMLGTCLRQAWDIAGIQLVYALTYFVLLSRAADARLTVDELVAKRGSAHANAPA
jgi:thiosulfate dehydrogenase [quinone] large subunit